VAASEKKIDEAEVSVKSGSVPKESNTTVAPVSEQKVE